MEIKNLRYFLAVAREENMSKAAEQLHVSQPTLSKTLKALEEELGKKLFTIDASTDKIIKNTSVVCKTLNELYLPFVTAPNHFLFRM